jgi:hypothetical protein
MLQNLPQAPAARLARDRTSAPAWNGMVEYMGAASSQLNICREDFIRVLFPSHGNERQA